MVYIMKGRPTEEEDYILTCLMEECGEVIKAASKVKRFGWDNWNPDNPTGNLVDLQKEILDFEGTVTALRNAYQKRTGLAVNPTHFVPDTERNANRARKIENLAYDFWLQESDEKGELE
jgi:NTP pyrophosphatase (non-canonical NTP hydrolase)